MDNHDNKGPTLSDADRVSRGRDPDPQAALCRKRFRGRGRFTQADVTRVIRAVKKEHLEIAQIRFEPDGAILVVPGSPQAVASSEANEWDE